MMNQSEVETTVQADQTSILDELVRLLDLARAQTLLSLKDSGHSFNALTGMFTELARDILEIKLAAAAGSGEGVDKACDACLDKAQAAVVNFQFYDKLAQRLEHMARSLKQTAALVGDRQGGFDPQAWERLREAIYAGYNIAEDRELFDRIMAGETVEEVVRNRPDVVFEKDKVELF